MTIREGKSLKDHPPELTFSSSSLFLLRTLKWFSKCWHSIADQSLQFTSLFTCLLVHSSCSCSLCLLTLLVHFDIYPLPRSPFRSSLIGRYLAKIHHFYSLLYRPAIIFHRRLSPLSAIIFLFAIARSPEKKLTASMSSP